MAILRGNTEGLLPKRVKVSGSFGMNAPSRSAGEAAKAYYELPIASGANIVVEANEGGTGGNSLDFQATADGLAKASLDLATLTTNIDTVIEAAAGGTAGNDITVVILGGAAANAGTVYEDATSKLVVFGLKNAGSTVADFDVLVAATTLLAVGTGGTAGNTFAAADDVVPVTALAGGTAAEWAAGVVGAVDGAHLHFEAGTTVAEAVTLINAASTTLTARAIDAGGGAHVFAGGDAVAKQDLAQGAQTTNDVDGDGFYVQKIGTCRYVIVLEDDYADMESCNGTLSLNAKADRDVLFEGYVPRSGSVPAYIIAVIIDDDDTGQGTTDSAVHANNRISFDLLMKNTN